MTTPEEVEKLVQNRFSAELFVAVDQYKGPRTAEGLKALALETLDNMKFRFLDGDMDQLNAAKRLYGNKVEGWLKGASDAQAYSFIDNIQKLPQAAEQGWALTDGKPQQRPAGTIASEADQIAAMRVELEKVKGNNQLVTAHVGTSSLVPNAPPPPPGSPTIRR